MNDSCPTKPKRRWYQFGLRMLLITVLVLGVFFGWLGSRLQRAARNREAAAEIQKVAAEIRRSGARVEIERLESPNWLERLLGDSGVFAVASVVASHGTKCYFGDADLERLKGLSNLERVELRYTQVTDAGLEYVKGLTSIESLNLSHTSVTDAGLVYMKQLTSLKSLCLDSTQVSDAGLEHLKGLISLEYLGLINTRVTGVGANGLEKALPKVTITPSPAQLAARDEIEKLGGHVLWTEYHGDLAGRGRLPRHAVDFRPTKLYGEPGTDVDAGLAHLQGLTSTYRLDLGYTEVTDAGLQHLKGLTSLEKLNLNGTKITDAGLEHLMNLANLKRLHVSHTQITDAGLEHLRGLSSLQDLFLHHTRVTDAGVKKLQQALPDCQIRH